MEKSTAVFDLNQAIQQWRQKLAQTPAIPTESLEEVETHLRDSVARWQTRELSAEEAFLIATKRLGNTDKIGAEFTKVNAPSVWVDRIFWAVVLAQAFFMVQNLGKAFANYSQPFVNNYLNFLIVPSAWLGPGLYFLETTIPLVVATILTWYFLETGGRFRNFMVSLSRRPFVMAMVLLGLSGVVHLLVVFSYHLPFSDMLPKSALLTMLPLDVFYACVIYVLGRKCLLKKA